MTVASLRDVEVGAQLPPFVRTPTFHHFNRYAAVNSEFVDHHMDDEAGKRSGYPGAIGMGNLTLAWLITMLREWAGDEGRLVRIECQFRAPVLRDDAVTCSGVVARRYEEDGELRYDIDLSATNQRGEALTPGTAIVAVRS